MTTTNQIDFKFNLGDEVKDVLTGYQGILTRRCEHITGCNTYSISPVMKKGDKSLPDVYEFDEDRIELIKADKLVLYVAPNVKSNKGAEHREVHSSK